MGVPRSCSPRIRLPAPAAWQRLAAPADKLLDGFWVESDLPAQTVVGKDILSDQFMDTPQLNVQPFRDLCRIPGCSVWIHRNLPPKTGYDVCLAKK